MSYSSPFTDNLAHSNKSQQYITQKWPFISGIPVKEFDFLLEQI